MPTARISLNAGTQPQVDVVFAMQIGEDLRHVVTEHPLQRQVRHFENGDVGSVVAGRRGNLQPNPARTNDDNPSTRRECRADSIRIR